MRKYPSYVRRFRKRDENSIEIAIPSKLLPILGFYKIETGKPPKKRVFNSLHKDATVNMWINIENNIEIKDGAKGVENIVGIFYERNVRVHGGSCVFSIHYNVIDSMRKRRIFLDQVKVRVNRHEHIELIPITGA